MITYHIDEVFGTRSRVAVLRVLSCVSVPLSIRQVAVQAGISHVAAMEALDVLTRTGVVASSVAGRSRVNWLERRNLITRDVVLPAFAAEAASGEATLGALRRFVPSDVLSAVIFGSYARGDWRPDSDLDVLIVCEDSASLAEALDEMDAAAEEMHAVFGTTVSVLGHTLAEVNALRGSGTFIDAAIAEGVVIRGTAPVEWGSLHEHQANTGGGFQGF